MSMEPQKRIEALRILCDAIIEAVKIAGPLGAPGGIMYAALMNVVTLDQFEQICGTLCRLGKIEKRGECYVIGKGEARS